MTKIVSGICSINNILMGGKGWTVEPLDSGWISDIFIAAELDKEDYDEMMRETKSKNKKWRPTSI